MECHTKTLFFFKNWKIDHVRLKLRLWKGKKKYFNLFQRFSKYSSTKCGKIFLHGEENHYSRMEAVKSIESPEESDYEKAREKWDFHFVARE